MAESQDKTTTETTTAEIVKTADQLWAQGNAPKAYKLLNKVNDYDHDIADEVAEAKNEIVILENRVRYLKDLVNEHKKYSKYIWRTAEGVNIPFHKIDTEHLTNILKHIADRGGLISKELRSEALSRGLTIPMQSVDIFAHDDWLEDRR